MATFYSSHNAAGAGAGTIGDPYTLQELLDNTDAGDLGLVMNTGTYTPSVTVDVDNATAATLANQAIIRGANSDGTDDGTVATISGSSLGASINLLTLNVSTLSINFEGLRITAATLNNILIGGSVQTANISFCRCRIDNASNDGIELQETSYPGVKIIDCEIDTNGGWGITPNNTSRYTPNVIGCKVHDNTSGGIKTGGNSALPAPCHILYNAIYDNGGDGIQISSTLASLMIHGNVLFGNTGDGIDISTGNYGVSLFNNIFRSNGGYGLNTNTGSLRQFAFIDYNCWSNNTSGIIDINGGSAPGGNDVTSDPVFTSETDGSEDFTLQATSPCLDVGLGYNG